MSEGVTVPISNQSAAQVAAKRAARHVARKRRGETLALYAWGLLAAGSIVAAVALSIPGPNQADEGPDYLAMQAPASAEEPVVIVHRETAEEPSRETLDLTTTASVPEEVAIEPAVIEAPSEASLPSDPVTVSASGSAPEVFGAMLVAGDRLDDLSAAFSNLKRRSPDVFASLEPRFVLIENEDALEARLLTGPFDTAQAVSRFCQHVKLNFTLACAPAPFGGEPLPRSE